MSFLQVFRKNECYQKICTFSMQKEMSSQLQNQSLNLINLQNAVNVAPFSLRSLPLRFTGEFDVSWVSHIFYRVQTFEMRNAGAVIHSHGIESCLVTMMDPGATEFRVTSQTVDFRRFCDPLHFFARSDYAFVFVAVFVNNGRSATWKWSRALKATDTMILSWYQLLKTRQGNTNSPSPWRRLWVFSSFK